MLAPPTETFTHIKSTIPERTYRSCWGKIDTFHIPLNPLWPERDPIPAVDLKVVHDGKRIALLCTWRDPLANGSPVRVQDFQDAVALQFSLNGKPPFLGMGDAKNPVNIWQWKAGWQQEVEGERPDVNLTYASMHTDFYFQTNALYHTAEAAGNLNAQRRRSSSIEDANARGFGTIASQSASSQNVSGKGVWRDGHWSVLFIRELKSRDADDVKLAVKNSAHVSFAIWDGENRDRNGRKVISNWYTLLLEP